MKLNSLHPIELCLYIEKIVFKDRRYKQPHYESDGFVDATKLYFDYNNIESLEQVDMVYL